MASRQMKAREAKARAQRIEYAKLEFGKLPYITDPGVQEMLFLAHNWYGNVRKLRAGPARGHFKTLGSGVSCR
jgi:hypothetical protein